MMVKKYSVRDFHGKPVRAVWNETLSKWWYSATDVVFALMDSKNPRIYWNAIKRRNPELRAFSSSQKLFAEDGKKYESDVLDEKGIQRLGMLLHSKHNLEFQRWVEGSLDSVDEQSKRKAHTLWESNVFDSSNVGKTVLLQQIHAFLFEGLYDFAGKIRTKTISKGGFVFANGDFLPQTLSRIDAMPDSSFDEIVDKYVEMNVAHPFLEGNGRATRIWLDFLLKERLGRCVDWSRIEKKDYLDAMVHSPIDARPIHRLLENSLTDEVNNRELFLKGIDHSYYYEEEDDAL